MYSCIKFFALGSCQSRSPEYIFEIPVSVNGKSILPKDLNIVLTLFFSLYYGSVGSTGWHRETGKFEVDVGSPVDVAEVKLSV